MKLMKFIRHYENRPFRLALIFSLPVLAVFFLMLGLLWMRDSSSRKQYFEAQMREAARAYFDQVLMTRLWNAKHGGVYVEVTEETRPNPYLEDPERDIVSVAGKHYTKINPAFMTREISELAVKNSVYRFHITSLNPINPGNTPDDWEQGVLGYFERGDLRERDEIMPINGASYFRYMAPLKAEEACLKCHAVQGYRLGDVRGGLSVSIPMEGYHAAERKRAHSSLLVFLGIGLAASASIISVAWIFSSMLTRSISMEVESQKLQSVVKLAGATAHEMRQPLTTIMGYLDLLKHGIKEGKELDEEMSVIIEQCGRVNNIIDKMLNITRYRTKPYAHNDEIFDFDNGSGESGSE